MIFYTDKEFPEARKTQILNLWLEIMTSLLKLITRDVLSSQILSYIITRNTRNSSL